MFIFKQSILDYFKGAQTDVIYTDLKRAFDKLNHKLLILKLIAYEFCDPILSWVESFLTKRTQFVKYKNFISDCIDVLSGVSHEDHLSSFLFLLFINDINITLKHSNFLLLADDLKLFNKSCCQMILYFFKTI